MSTALPARRRWDLSAYAFISPALLLAAVFVVLPAALAFYYSFTKIAPLSGATSWLGLGNYRTMLTDPTFYRALVNTLLFTVLVVPLSLGLGLLLATTLNAALPGRRIARTAIYLPLVVSGVAVGLIGTFLFNETIGVFDKMLQAVGLPGIAWQSSPAPAFASVVLITLWIRVGFTMIVYLGAIQAIPAELLEAARVDGANRRRSFRHITIPMLRSATFFLTIMSVIYSFQVFDTVYVLTGGGPGSATEVLGTYAYKTAYGPARNQGYGAAIGVIIFLATLVFTLAQWRAARRAEF